MTEETYEKIKDEIANCDKKFSEFMVSLNNVESLIFNKKKEYWSLLCEDGNLRQSLLDILIVQKKIPQNLEDEIKTITSKIPPLEEEIKRKYDKFQDIDKLYYDCLKYKENTFHYLDQKAERNNWGDIETLENRLSHLRCYSGDIKDLKKFQEMYNL